MASSILPRIDAVFIHVSNLQSALQWYAEFFGVDPGPISHEGLIADMRLDGETTILFDGHAYARGERVDRSGTRFMVRTHDLDAAHDLANRIGHNVSEPEDIGSAVVFYLDDPDGNRLCVIRFKHD